MDQLDTPHQPLNTDMSMSMGFALQIGAIVVASLLTYATVASRVAVVESQQLELRKQLEQIDTSLRGINQNIYELLKLEAANRDDR